VLTVEPHPLLELAAFTTTFPAPLGDLGNPIPLPGLLGRPHPAALARDVDPTAVRDLLRQGGFKPAGRNKPASEYVRNAVPEGRLDAINPAVDACNAASFFSGLPISVVDLDRVEPPLRVAVAPADTSYVFNASGQEIRVDGLLCLFDALGPCANAVKDSQRTKTSEATRRTLSLVWGTTALPGRAAATAAWYRAVLEETGARTEAVPTGA
jgi:DNA/RNA-binding domain of Phe-tRNA-synthetase-like protein